MADLNLHFASDNTIAYLDVPESGSVKPSLNVLQALIKRSRIVFGINQAIITEIAQGNLSGTDVPIAIGKPMKPGVDGHLEWYVSYLNACKPQQHEDGKVDYRELQNSQNVIRGDRIARIIKAVPGVPGRTVFNEIISPPAVSEAQIIIGAGAVAEAGIIKATRDGAIKFDGKIIEVCNCKTIAGDIDYSTGNVLFNGQLRIEGTVRSGFKVAATGDILISGGVEDAEIKSDSSVIIEGGAVGAARGTIRSAGSILLRHVSKFTLIAGKDITVREDALHTTMIADEKVYVKNIIGGSINALCISSETAGSATGVTTVLDVTRNEQVARERYDLLKQFGVHMTGRIGMYDEIYALVRDGMDGQGLLSEKDEQTLASIKARILSSIETSNGIQSRLTAIESMEKNRASSSFVKVGRIFPGVVVKVLNEERLISAEEKQFYRTSAGA